LTIFWWSFRRTRATALILFLSTTATAYFIGFRPWPRRPILTAFASEEITPSRSPSLAPSPPASGHALKSCGTLSGAGTTYVLQQDISAPGTCLSIQANNITVDLNGHSILYATAGGEQPRYGILAQSCWDTTLAGNPCGGTADRLTVINGSITQAKSAPPYSHAIRLGQINGTNHLTVHDVTFEVSSISSIPIFTTFLGADSAIYANTFHNNVTTIHNRHQIEGATIKFANDQGNQRGQSIHDNKIFGGAQGGIFSASPGTKFFNNTIRQNGRYSNDFSIYAWGNDSEVSNNILEPLSGRGIQIAGGSSSVNGHGQGARGASVHDNKINVIELKQNCDYSAGMTACNVCELGGAYGIQFDDGAEHGTVVHNSILARADECQASGLRVTEVGLGDVSHDNTYTAQLVGSRTGQAYGISLAMTNKAPDSVFTSQDDSFTADTALVFIDWGAAGGGLHCIRCTLAKGPNASPNFHTFDWGPYNTGESRNLHFQDTVFLSGANKDDSKMSVINSNHPYAEYFIDWTLTLTVQDQSGKPVFGATVIINDAVKEKVFEGVTDAKGEISTVLNEFKRYNTRNEIVKTMHSPHTVHVSGGSCKLEELVTTVTMNQTTAKTVQGRCTASR
jgi:hypothetical protein